jgi:hypothetical protein
MLMDRIMAVNSFGAQPIAAGMACQAVWKKEPGGCRGLTWDRRHGRPVSL